MGNPACEDKIDRRSEVVAVLQKERPLFWKEDLKPLVDRDLRLIGFNLAEVGIDRGIEHEAIVQNEFRIQADFRLQGSAFKKRIRRIPLIDIAEAPKQRIRDELNIPRRRNVIEAGRRCRDEAAWPRFCSLLFSPAQLDVPGTGMPWR